ncbi:hypothetical protein R0K19_23370, partial [Bacillus sp. SIMBA_161]
VTGFLQNNGQVKGAKIRDVLSDDTFDVQAKAVVNTSGPWLNHLLRSLPRTSLNVPLAKAINLVTRPLFNHSYAVGLSSQIGSRLFFIAPWG